MVTLSGLDGGTLAHAVLGRSNASGQRPIVRRCRAKVGAAWYDTLPQRRPACGIFAGPRASDCADAAAISATEPPSGRPWPHFAALCPALPPFATLGLASTSPL